MIDRARFFVLLLVGVALPCWPAMAETANQLRTTGVGQVEVLPSRAVLNTVVAGSAEDAGDAMTKYTDAKRRALEALNGLGIDGVTVEELGLSLAYTYDQQQINMMRNGQGDMSDLTPRLVASERLRLVIDNVDQLDEPAFVEATRQVMATVQDSGLEIGVDPITEMARYGYGYAAQPKTLFTFEYADEQALIDQARVHAIQDAKDRAGRIATAIGSELGPIVSFSESVEPPGGVQTDFNGNRIGIQNVQVGDAITSSQLGPGMLKVRINVGFEILTTTP